MLRIESVALLACAEVGRVAVVVARRDASLADQMRRAMASVALNISEANGSQGGNRNARFFDALGSAREVRTALNVAVAFGYVREIDAQLVDRLDHVCATLWRLVHR